VVPLLPAQDFKRVGDDDSGPNTGGMGAYAPLPWAPPGLADDLVRRIVAPVARELVARGTPFTGLLYAGIVLTATGPAVIEFNCRFGDPETQVVLALLRSPLAALLNATATGTLAEQPAPEWADGAAVVVVLAADGYPATPRLGDVIAGSERDGVLHAGTRRRDDGAVVSTGGRVLSVVGTGDDLAAARAEAYRRLAEVHLAGSHHRTDIASRAERGEVSIPQIPVPDDVEWLRSSMSTEDDEGSVEVALLPDGGVALRDGSNPDGQVHVYTAAEWDAFVKGVHAGEFDRP
jgi:phosphoribosylamine--glycine ligase